jgi:hypothetical protein
MTSRLMLHLHEVVALDDPTKGDAETATTAESRHLSLDFETTKSSLAPVYVLLVKAAPVGLQGRKDGKTEGHPLLHRIFHWRRREWNVVEKKELNWAAVCCTTAAMVPTINCLEPKYFVFYSLQSKPGKNPELARKQKSAGNRIEDQIGPRVLSATSSADRLCQPATRSPPPSLSSPISLC